MPNRTPDILLGAPSVQQPVVRPSSLPDNDLDLVQELRQLYKLAWGEKKKRYDIWQRNYRLTNNRVGGQSQSWMPAPRDSEVYPALSALVGWVTDQETTVDISPAVDPGSDFYDLHQKVGDDLETVYTSTWHTEGYNFQLKLGLWDILQFGSGIFKAVWDNAAGSGYGNPIMKRVDPWAFYPDPNATSEHDAEYFVEVHRMSYSEIERRFPDTVHRLEERSGPGDGVDTRPDLFTEVARVPMANPGALPGGQVRYGAARSDLKLYDPLPGYVVYEFWLRENEFVDDEPELNPVHPELSERHVVDKWRVVCMANSQILLDEPAKGLWSHGLHPYTRIPFDDIGEFWGISLVDHLAYPQIYINRLLTALEHNTELTGNPVFLEPTNSGLDRVNIVNRPGIRLKVNSAAATNNRPDWLQPPQMPPITMDLIQFWIARIENISGLSAIVKGATPNQRNAEGVISSIQEAAFVRIRSFLRNYERGIEDLSYKLLDLIIDNYTEPRIMTVVGPDSEKSSMILQSHHFIVPTESGSFPLVFGLQVEAGSSTPTSRQAKMAEYDKLFAMGAIDDQAVLEAHRIKNSKAIIKRKYDKLAQGIPQGPGARQRAQRSR